jgi:hypothetical protein
MPVVLPDISETNCVLFRACGMLRTSNTPILNWIKKQPDWMVARRRGRNGMLIVRAGFGGKSGKHCHVEIGDSRFFEKKPAKATHRVDEIRSILEHLKGEEISVDLEADYPQKIEELPPIIRDMTVKSVVNEVSIQLTGGSFTLEGAPIRSIGWGIKPGDDLALLMLETTKLTTISDSYLADALGSMNAAKDAFIGGRLPHA